MTKTKLRTVDKIAEVIKTLVKKGVELDNIKANDITDESGGSITRHMIKDNGGINMIKRRFFPHTTKNLAVVKELATGNHYISKLENKLVQSMSLEQTYKEALNKIPKIKMTPYKAKKNHVTERALNVVLSDLHIGSDIKKRETGQLDFGKTEEARRLAKITKEIIDYKRQYRDSTVVNLLLLGDIIQNSLHDQRDGAPTAEQSARAIFLLSQAISQIASSFPEVNVYCNTGNHGRNTGRHHGRAVNQKWDSVETIIYYALKNSFKDVSNVKFHLPQTPYVTYEVFGKKIFATHGDTVLNPGYPNKVIKTSTLEGQINRINATLDDKDEYAVFIVGHVHVGSITHLSNGTVMITNGALVPSDEFAVSIGLLENSCGQYMFESVKEFPVGDTRFIRVSHKDDTDSSLDKIIQPFKEL
jgi:hypothetical protein